jgi:hypothetical protein
MNGRKLDGVRCGVLTVSIGTGISLMRLPERRERLHQLRRRRREQMVFVRGHRTNGHERSLSELLAGHALPCVALPWHGRTMSVARIMMRPGCGPPFQPRERRRFRTRSGYPRHMTCVQYGE